MRSLSSLLREAVVTYSGGLVTLPVELAAKLARCLPQLWPKRHNIQVLRDISYGPLGAEQTLDLYLPVAQPKPWPIIFYIHGGGFTAWSKDTYWLPGFLFAQQGFFVVNINYRLAPRHPFPAALNDASLAYRWLTREAKQLGGDLERLVLAGDSSGANLALGLTLSACASSEEPWATPIFATGVVPRALICSCSFLEVSDPLRRYHAGKTSLAMARRISKMSDPYLLGAKVPDAWRMWADPLSLLEQGFVAQRPLPPVSAPVGLLDPILDDTRRLQAALGRLGVHCEAPEYKGGIHGFHFLLWSEIAKQCWKDTFDFLSRTIGAPNHPLLTTRL